MNDGSDGRGPGTEDLQAAVRSVTQQLAAIQQQLLDTPADEFATRHALRTTQDQLRAEAAALGASRPLTGEERSRLEQRLRLLHHRRAELSGSRVTARQTASSAGMQTQGGSINGAALMAIDRAILDAGGLDGLGLEIAALEQRLAPRRRRSDD